MQALSSCPEPSTPKQIRVAPHPVKVGRSGKLCKFTRHPKALARVVNFELRAATRFVLGVLLTFADKQGRALVSPRTIVELAPRSQRVRRYSLVSVRRALRELRDVGLLDWERVLPGECYPTGVSTNTGGRVWHLNLARLRGEDGSAEASTDRSPVIDRRSITHDRSSDPLCLSSRDKIGSRAPEPRDGRASPAHEASETPSAAPATEAIAATAEACTPREVASETPPAAIATRVFAPASRPATDRDESSGGNGEQTRGQRGAPVVSAAQQLEDLRRLFPGFTTRPPSESLPREQRSSVETDEETASRRTD